MTTLGITPALRPRNIVGLYFAGALTVYVIAVLWLRTGLVPAASGGDEVWWSESGYHFLREGILRWGCMDDVNGSATVSYWPPVAPLLQAAMLKIFGLTAFGIYAQSSLVATLMMATAYQLAHIMGLPTRKALFASCALFGLFMVERRLVQVRMENLTALAGLGYTCLILHSAADRRVDWRVVCAGLVAGIGLFCYYPQSPFLVLSCLGGLMLLKLPRLAIVLVGVGLLIPTIAAALWIAPHWDLFRKQILDAGTSDYWSATNLLVPFRRLTDVGAPASIVQQLEKWAALLLGIYGWWIARSKSTRFLATMTVSFSLPMFVYSDSPQVAAGIFAVLLVFCLAVERDMGALSRILNIAQIALVVAAFVKISLLGITAVYQHEGRSYAAVASDLRKSVPTDQPIAISQRAWLGLRGIVVDPNLQFLTYSGPSLRQRPRVTLDANADRYFTTLVLESHILPTLRTVYPWIARGIDRGEYRLVKTIAPTLAPLPWAKDPCYDLLVYRRENPRVRITTE